MVLGKFGQATLLGLMLFTLAIIVAILLIQPMKELIVDVRGQTQLDCSATNLSTGTSMTCIFVDLILPYFIGSIIVAAGGLIAYKYGITG